MSFTQPNHRHRNLFLATASELGFLARQKGEVILAESKNVREPYEEFGSSCCIVLYDSNTFSRAN